MIILIAEDLVQYQKIWTQDLNQKGHLVIPAYTLREGLHLLQETPHVDVFVLDGCLNKENVPDYMELLKAIKVKYPEAPIVAASKSSDLRKRMVEEGCTHETIKNLVPDEVLFAIEDLEP